jgi:hypothetical protein
MTLLRYTLLSDGPSDRCLLRIIDWLMAAGLGVANNGIIPQFADLRQIANPPSGLAARMRMAILHYPCDILFIHRDAERDPHQTRLREIETAAEEAREILPQLRVSIVPVRMTEAWLLLEPDAIRRAADNPNGSVHLDIPPITEVEAQPNPKQLLDDLLIAASEKSGRRRDKFRRELSWRRARVADFIQDFSRLHSLSAFASFAAETSHAVQSWHRPR